MRRAPMNPRDVDQVWTANEAARWLDVEPESVRRFARCGDLVVWKRTSGGKRLFRPADVVALGVKRTEDLVNGRRRAPTGAPQIRLPLWGGARVPAARPLPWHRFTMLRAGLRQAKTEGEVPHSKHSDKSRKSGRVA